MSNFKLDSGHDIIIGRGATRVDGISDEYITQLVKCRLLFILGTWELDISLGIPWLQTLLVKDVEDSLFQGIIYDAIKNTPGVSRVDEIRLNRDHDKRIMYISFKATTVNKAEIELEVARGGSN